jgi:hypothetical protein
LNPFFYRKKGFKLLKKALEEAWTLSIPARDYPSLDPDPLLKSGGNIFCVQYFMRKYCIGK